MQNNIEQLERYLDEIENGLTPFADFVPFEDPRRPRFPTEKLPGVLGAFVDTLAVSTQTPPEMAGLLSLGVLATLFQGRYDAEINPDWREPLCLYCAAVAPPGERKSAVIHALTLPIYEEEAERRERDRAAIEQNRAERDVLEERLARTKRAAAKAGGDQRAVMELAAELADFRIRRERRWLADDTTPEKLVELMEQQGGCLTVCSAEGGVFDAMLGRYDRVSNFDIYLKAHAGDPVVVDRIGRLSNRVQDPRLSMLLTVQPEVLTGLMSNNVFRGRGLCGRFLFAVCSSRVGHREISPPPIPENLRAAYQAFVRRALAGTDTGTIRLSPEADAVRIEVQTAVEMKLGTVWDAMADWGGKAVGAMVRIAALLHCAQADGNPADSRISGETMRAASAIMACLSCHAEAAYSVMGADPDVDAARYILKRIAGAERITRSELLRLCRGRFKRAQDLDPALALLMDRGYLRELHEGVGYNQRVTTVFEINPAYSGIHGNNGNDGGRLHRSRQS